MEKWFQVVTYNACFGIILNERNIIIDSAPIGRRFIGMSINDFKHIMGWKVKSITPIIEKERKV